MKDSKDRFYKKLARLNVEKNISKYFIYLLTLSLAVALFYSFNSLAKQFKILNIRDDLNNLGFGIGMIFLVSIFISGIMAFLISYTNKFILSTRKKEFGVYLSLGMDYKEINKLLLREILIIASLGIVFGLGIGIILSHVLNIITMKIMNQNIGEFKLFISGFSILLTLILYFLTFIFVYNLNKREIAKLELIDLLNASRKNEKVKRSWVLSGLFLFLTILAWSFSYFIFKGKFLLSLKNTILIGLSLTLVGIFLFFLGGLGFILDLISKNKSFYYRGVNSFTISNLSSKIKSSRRLLSVVTSLLFLSFFFLFLGVSISESLKVDLPDLTPYDISIDKHISEEGFSSSLVEDLEKIDLDPEEYFAMAFELNIYKSPVKLGYFISEDYADKPGISNLNLEMNMIALSQYNQALVAQGKKPIKLERDKFLVNYSQKQYDNIYKEVFKHGAKNIQINGHNLSSSKEAYKCVNLATSNILSDPGTIVVNDYILDGEDAYIKYFSGNLKEDKSESEFFKKYLMAINTTNMSYSSKENINNELNINILTTSYIGLYMAISFLIASITVLGIQQLISINKGKDKYLLLKNLGSSDKQLLKSMNSQSKLYFFIPLVLGLGHSILLNRTINTRLVNMDMKALFKLKLLLGSFLVLVYFIYYIIILIYNRKHLKRSKEF